MAKTKSNLQSANQNQEDGPQIIITGKSDEAL